MSESEMNSPAPDELGDQIAAPDELSDQIAGLRQQVFTLLLALIVVSGTLAAYLSYQSRAYGEDIANMKPRAMEVIQTYGQSRAKLESFVNQIIAYGQTHPDFQRQVLNKYSIKPGPAK
jgi:hypothetical protein